MKRINWKKVLPHVWAILIFFVLSVAYFAPVVLGEKTMGQGDVHSVSGIQRESKECYEQTGERTHWSNMLFGGMPNVGSEGYNVYGKIFPKIVMGGLPYLNAGVLFFYMLGFYILMCVLGCRSWLSIMAAVAYAFSTYNIVIIDAGHLNKCWAMACMAPIIAGVIQCLKGKYISGALITLIFTGLHIMYSHQQITFYLMFMLLAVAIAYLIQAIRQKQMKTYWRGAAVAVVTAFVAVLPTMGSWLVTYDYSKDTMRGGAVLQQNAEGEKESKGLDIDYAFQWSYGKMESFTALVPGLYGGSSHYYVSPKSETYKLTRGQQTMAPLYWGDQPFTSGPVYMGAIICFLFILGLFVVKGPEKWWLLAVTILSFMLAWGRHLSWFNDFLFYHLPLYSSFRTPSMALVIAEISMVALGVLAVQNLMKKGIEKKNMRDLAYSFGITAGICLFFALFGKSMFSLTSPTDASYPDWFQKVLLDDRASLLVSNAMRSFGFILLAAACLWFYMKNKLKADWLVGILLVLVTVDLWAIDRHYVGEKSFVPARSVKAVIPSAIDNMILADTDPDYRVFNATVNTFNDASTSNFHKSIGGYSPMKLRRYQDIIDYHFGRRFNVKVLNMLNTRYFIAPDANGQPMVQRNVAALGNAWFIDSIQWVNSPDEEIVALYDFDPATTAIIDKEWKDKVGMEQVPASVAADNDGIRLVEYYPNSLKYEYTASQKRPAVFSEVYYKTWKAYVDGEEVPLYRVNYILRGLTLPEGTHEVLLKCKNPLIVRSKILTNTGSAVNILLILALIGMLVRNGLKQEKPEVSKEK